LPARRISPSLAWCEDTADRRYNCPFQRAAGDGGDRLWRDDQLYDFILENGPNVRPRGGGGGGAPLRSRARAPPSPARGRRLARNDLQRLLAMLGPQTRLLIEL